MNHENYIKLAIQAAKESEQNGGCPIGAVIAKRGQVIAVGMSMAGITNDVTDHAEIMAIRKACEITGSSNLEDCILYSTLEPCSMCIGASLWANLPAIYFASYAEDVTGNAYEYNKYSSEKIAKNSSLWDGSPIKIEGGILREECVKLMQNYKDWQVQ